MELKDYAGALLESLRQRTPLVHCIVNTVVQQFAANVLLAAGASPAMIDHEADAADFAGIADGLLINFGTPTSHQYLSADGAIDTFNQAGKPWVLDPVGFGISGHRTSRIVRALNSRPAVVRGKCAGPAGFFVCHLGGRGEVQVRCRCSHAGPRLLAEVLCLRSVGGRCRIGGGERS